MIVPEMKPSIVNHRISLASNLLPVRAGHAKSDCDVWGTLAGTVSIKAVIALSRKLPRVKNE